MKNNKNKHYGKHGSLLPNIISFLNAYSMVISLKFSKVSMGPNCYP